MQQYYLAPTWLHDHQIKVVTKQLISIKPNADTSLPVLFISISTTILKDMKILYQRGKQSLSFDLITPKRSKTKQFFSHDN